MKLKDIKPGIRYRVLDNGILRKGDSVWISFNRYLAIRSTNALKGAFIPEKEWLRLCDSVEVDIDYYRSEISHLASRIDEHKKSIEEYKSIIEEAEK